MLKRKLEVAGLEVDGSTGCSKVRESNWCSVLDPRACLTG